MLCLMAVVHGAGGCITYHVGQQPGYINRGEFLTMVKAAFRTWSSATGVSFECVVECVLGTFEMFPHDNLPGNM